MSIISRTDRGLLAQWWWTVDRWMLASMLLLIVLGVVLSLAASPPVAERLGLSEFHFTIRHVIYAIPAAVVVVATSFLDDRQARRAALVIVALGFMALMLTLAYGPEVKGARRWLDIGPFSIQPSEFVKPAFVILSAWLFAEGMRRPEIPGNILATALLAMFVTLLVLQPDYGQTVLVAAVWSVMLFMTGISWLWIGALGVTGFAGMVVAYLSVSHVARRLDRFLAPGEGDTYQVDMAMEAFARGGLFGRGPGEGSVKYVLPDAHSDFIFAVVGEEFGILACLLLAAIFAFVVHRGLARALEEWDPFRRIAVAGLTALFGFQALINMAVNVSLLPAKGMTLPFVSYGGSSLISVGFAMGLVLALTRRRPRGTAIVPPRSRPATAAGYA